MGAGVSGLVCARTLADHGSEVVVFDKGRRPGGRLATRTAETWSYDHGAPFFTVRNPRFGEQVRRWIENGVVAEWRGRIVTIEGGARRPTSSSPQRYVGVPQMNSLAAHLALGCDVRNGIRVQDLKRVQDHWYLAHEAAEEGPYDFVVVTVPAPQALPLLESAPELRRQVAEVHMQPCWAVLLAFASPLDVDFDGAFMNEGALSWIARDGSKPGRSSETWVLQASAGWTREHLEDEREQVAATLTGAFAEIVGDELPKPIDRQAHRWRYAAPARPLPSRCLFDRSLGIVVCGDSCGGGGVEGAFLSGSAAADCVLAWVAD